MALLPENVDAETRFIAERITAIAGTTGEIIVDQPPVPLHQRQRDLLGLVGRERLDRRIDIDRFELAVIFALKRVADRKVQVGDAVISLEHRREDFVEIGNSHTVSSVASGGGSLRNCRNLFLSFDLS